MTLMLRKKEPRKKDSAGCVKELLKCVKWSVARASMQMQRIVNRQRSKMKTMRPMV